MPCRYLALILAVLLAGCEAPEEAASLPENPEIAWFDGKVEAGFALAEAQGKPVYLYWGAVWCPPCQEIKHTVFKSREFIAQTTLFVPIYLDGDTPEAQAWGEKFGVRGYPTMIVFNPAGEEITRIPGGIDIERYNTVLSLSLESMRPTAALVGIALKDASALSAAEMTQLAYYSWGQDNGALPDDAPDTFFRDLSLAAADPAVSARFYLHYLVALARQLDEEPDALIAAPDAFERLMAILADDERVLAGWDTLGYYAVEIVTLPVFAADEQAQLAEHWGQRLFSLREHPALSPAEQLAGWLPRLELHEALLAGPLPAPLLDQLRAELQAADAASTNAFARQSVVNQINYVYQAAGLYDEAEALLLAALDKASSPYYFMSSLGSLAEKAGRVDEAIAWRQRAYDASEGGATRFQWGASYVRALIRLAPEDNALIVTSAVGLFDDLGSEEEVFAGRNFRVLRTLNRELLAWAEAGEASMDRFRGRLASLCERQVKASTAAGNCQSLVSNEAG